MLSPITWPKASTSRWLPPNRRRHRPLATGDELASQQWYLSAVKAPEAWSLLAAPGRSIEPVKVAVLDTGASISHSDLQDSIDMSRSGEVVWVDMQAGKVSTSRSEATAI